MKQVRIHSPKSASLSLRWPAVIGGGALLWLLPVACSLSTEGDNYGNAGSSGSPVSSSNGASSSSGSSAGGGGAGDVASSTGPGMGGAGGGTGGGGTGGGGPLVYAWQATDPGPVGNPCTSTYTYALPPWLTFKSPMDGERTSQVSENKLCRGYIKDQPRARNVGKGWGLSVESERTNLALYSDGWTGEAGWSQGNMSVQTSLQDPAGGTGAIEFNSPASVGGNYSNFIYPAILSQVGSSWLRGSFGVPPYAHFRHVIEGKWIDVTLNEWRRYSIAQDSDKSGDMALETRDKPTGAGVIELPTKIQAFGAQAEAGAKYASSYIPTTGAPVKRDAEALFSQAASDLIKGGWLDVEIKIAPNYASDQKSEQHDILYFNDQNRVSIATDNRIELRIADNVMETKEIPFMAEDELTIIALNTPTGRSLTVKVNGVEIDTNSDMKQAMIELPVVFYILGDTTGAQECADLRAIKFTQVASP